VGFPDLDVLGHRPVHGTDQEAHLAEDLVQLLEQRDVFPLEGRVDEGRDLERLAGNGLVRRLLLRRTQRNAVGRPLRGVRVPQQTLAG
jgi:hypothetical protein